MPDHTHQNLHNQFITLINKKLHAQNKLHTFFGFLFLLILIASLSMPDHTHLKPHHQFVALMDMYLHAENQLWSKKVFHKGFLQ